jgi:hypothetical protein
VLPALNALAVFAIAADTVSTAGVAAAIRADVQ